MSKTLNIAVMPGDGIGTEVMAACRRVLDVLLAGQVDFGFVYDEIDAGAALFTRTGSALPAEAMERARAADAILLGAMGLPSVRGPDGREIAPQLDLREELELFAGLRPVKTFPGMPLPLADRRAEAIDLVLVRESTEGLFAGRNAGTIEDDAVARNTLVITRGASERLFRYCFELARRRKANGHAGRVTCVDKSNVLKAFGFFREIFDQIAEEFPDVQADHCYVDAMALNMVRHPWAYDVVVTENMFGDILSDLGAGLMGGMGMAPSADIGPEHAVFQPCHGSAPDIAGSGKANPTAMLLSAAMMLDWLGERHGLETCRALARALDSAVHESFAGGTLRPYEQGGGDGTAEITEAVLARLEPVLVQAAG